MQNDNQKKSKIVQTYAEDMAHVLEDEKGGIIKKIIHSEEQNEIEKKNLSPESKNNKIFMLLGLLLILASFATLSFFFFRKEVPSIPVQRQFAPLIFTDRSALLEVGDLKKGGIEERVLAEINTATKKNGGVEGIYFTLKKSPIGLRKFIEIIEANFIPSNGNFVDDNFLMGAVKNKIKPALPNTSLGGSTSPLRGEGFFMLLKMRSIADIFSSMRAWENKMFLDLHGFLGIDISPETKYLLTKSFEDGIVENKNARILYDKENKIVVMYVFADENSVIITNTENAAREIMLRLASSKVKK